MSLSENLQDKTKNILNFFDTYDNFLITTHVNSDGDALASVLACSMFLEIKNKKYTIILDDQTIDDKYAFLDNFDKIQSYSENKKEHYSKKTKAALIFDAPDAKRIGEVATLINGDMPALKIDHHPSDYSFGPHDWVDSSASSASAMFFEVIKLSNVNLNQEIAESLYTGIIYDTGRLSFSNTRARDLEICAELIRHGAKPAKITNALFFNNNARALKVVGNGLNNLKQFADGKISLITLFNKDLNGVEQSEIEELANYSVSLRDSEVGVFIREIEPNFFKLSLRSKNYVDVSLVAGQFDGGGHVRASGCRFKGNYDDLVQSLVQEIKKQL